MVERDRWIDAVAELAVLEAMSDPWTLPDPSEIGLPSRLESWPNEYAEATDTPIERIESDLRAAIARVHRLIASQIEADR